MKSDDDPLNQNMIHQSTDQVDPIKLLRELHASGNTLSKEVADAYLKEVYEDRKNCRDPWEDFYKKHSLDPYEKKLEKKLDNLFDTEQLKSALNSSRAKKTSAGCSAYA